MVWLFSLFLFFLLFQCSFIWQHRVLIACRIFCWGIWDLPPWPGVWPGFSALGAKRLSRWTTRGVTLYSWDNDRADYQILLRGKHMHVPSLSAGLWKQIYFCSITQSCPTLWDPMDCSPPGFPVLQYLLQFAQTHVLWVGEAAQPSHPLKQAMS